MKKKMKQLVDYFTVRNVKINMHDNSPENIAEFKRLEFVFYFRPVLIAALLLCAWFALVFFPFLQLDSVSVVLFAKIGASLGLLWIIFIVIVIMEGRRLNTHLYY